MRRTLANYAVASTDIWTRDLSFAPHRGGELIGRLVPELSDFGAVEIARAMSGKGFTDTTATVGGMPANYQPVESAWHLPDPTAFIDSYAPNPSTTGTLVVDGAHVIAASDTPGDNDWFAVTLTAGQTYQFGQYAYVGGIPPFEANGVPLADAYLEIYDAAGNLLSIADGGGPNTPSGLDALMTFEAPHSGTFYVNATSYDNTGDGVGDFAGDYEIFAQTAAPGTTYTTHYDISSPLHSIDWGGVLVNREHVSVRNPDGMEGPRPTGEPAADPGTVEGNALGYPGKNVVYLYFAGQGDLYANADSTIPGQVVVQNPYQYEVQAMLTAANEFSKVADVVFVSNYTFNATTHLWERNENIEYKPGPLGPEAGVQYATGVADDGFDADFFYFSYPGTPGPGISLLGSMSPPDYGDEGTAQFNSADERWSAQMLQPGGFSFVTLIHEFGHGMGLAHPHDTGGGSSVMQGVVTNGVPGDDGGAGAFDLNQGVNTMMSYNDGWEKSPYGQAETNNEGYGWLGSLMALDIAVIQDKYGVNEDWAAGNDTYVLKDVNEWGVYIDAATGQPAVHDATNQLTTRDGYYEGESTRYSSIWDAGGIDQITYSGARDTNIDLRAATLRYEYGGAGWMSYADGIFGGYTIANGVTIENASSGSGDDTLIGNGVSNRLNGGLGNDTLDGAGDLDTAVFSGLRSASVISRTGATITGVDGTDGNDTLTSIERLEFADGTAKFAFHTASQWVAEAPGADGWNIGDFNGDGKDDIFRYAPGQSGADMFLSDGTGFDGAGSWTGAGYGTDNRWHIGDFNGDGKDDIFRYLPGQSGANVHLSTGTAFADAGSWTGAGFGSDGTWHVGDFNGDGKDDIFRYLAGGSGADMFLSTGTGFASAGSWTSSNFGSDGTWYIGDFNGDGKDDIFRYVEGSSGAEVFLSDGSSFVSAGSWTGYGYGTDNQWHVADFDGDGKDDLLRYIAGQSGGEVLLSTGTAFAFDGSWTGFGNGSDNTWHIGDFNGDGNGDLMRVFPTSTEVLI